MKNSKLSVVWGIDEKYIIQAFVVMHSILDKSDSFFEFYVFTADDIKEKILEYTELLRQKYDNFAVEVVKVDAESFRDARIFAGHLSKAAYNRLLIAQSLPKCDKCIYLDCDVLVQGDLKELFNVDVEEYYLAGVKDCHVIADTEREREHERMMGIPNRDFYINSGVMVMNLKKIREDNLTQQFLEACKNENWNEDQDVLNVCCYGKIKLLPLYYNLFHFYIGNKIKQLFHLPYKKSDFNFDWHNPLILHMGSEYKPWISNKICGSQKWWEYAKLFCGTQEYLYYKKVSSQLKDCIRGLDVIRQWCYYRKNIVIWGFTNNGRKVCDCLLPRLKNKIVAFVDNDSVHYDKKYEGIPTVDMYTIQKDYNDVGWVISCKKAYGEVIQQLEEAGINRENILWWNEYTSSPHKYYMALARECYEQELRDIALVEGLSLEELKEGIKKNDEKVVCLNYKYHFNYWILCDYLPHNM